MVDGSNPENRESNAYQIKAFTRTNTGIDLENYKESLVAFFNESFPGNAPGDSEEAIDTMTKDACEAILVAVSGDRVVGYGSLNLLDDAGNMEFGEAHVSPSYRRQGIFSQLIDTSLNIAKQKGAKSVSLEAVDTNLAQQSLIDRHGFEKTGQRHYRKIL